MTNKPTSSTVGTAVGALVDSVDGALRPELEDQIEHSVAALIATQVRTRGARPCPSWIKDVPAGLLGDALPERSGECRRMLAEVEGWLADLGAIPPPRDWTPQEIIEASDPEHVAALCEALGLKHDPLPPASAVVAELSSVAGNSFANLWRRVSKRPPLSYASIVREVAEIEKLTVQGHEAPAAIEEQIIRNRFVRIIESLPPEKRDELKKQFEAIAQKYGRSYYGEAGAGGALVLANASGFGVYMMASTVVGAVSNALGLGLGFGFYIAMSKTISLLIPGGFAAVTALTAYKLASPNKKRMVAAVLHLGAMRAYLMDKLERTKSDMRARQMELVERVGPAEDSPLRAAPSWRQRVRRWKWWLVTGAVILGSGAGIFAIKSMLGGQ